jgi:hypothetical protein
VAKFAKFGSRKSWKILLNHCFYCFLNIGKLIAQTRAEEIVERALFSRARFDNTSDPSRSLSEPEHSLPGMRARGRTNESN